MPSRKQERAYATVRRARASGKLAAVKNYSCAHCGTQATEFHHPNYDEPLNVIPLCNSCHKQEHIRLRAEDINLNIGPVREKDRRAVIAVSIAARERLNRLVASLGIVQDRKVSQDDTIVWLLDQYNREYKLGQ